jgi:molecular chaperone IbpA
MQNSSFLIGFDDMFDRFTQIQNNLAKQVTYPPYNLSKVDDNKYLIELAVAGFGKQNIELELAEGTLKISGKIEGEPTENYIHKGIATRPFERKFALEDHIEVKDASMVNGLLRIWLERIIPEHKKPKKIEVKDAEGEVSSKQLLTE